MKEPINLTDAQLSAVDMVRRNWISLLSGSAGTGKTTTLLSILQMADAQGWEVLQASPTGKAAKRMMESTHRPATTIHAMLVCEFDGGDFSFRHNKDNPLRADLIILDESSMIDNSLMAAVFEAIDPDRTRLLMVGDPYQLPSVGTGAVFRDFIDSGLFPHVELTVIHRNTGRILEVCHSVRSKKLYFPDDRLDLEAENPINLIHVECDTPEKTQQGVEAIMCDRLPLRGFNPVDDVMVLSPVNTKGLLSCLALNRRLRERLNIDPCRDPSAVDDEIDEQEKVGAKMEFRQGDKVIQTKNEQVKTPENEQTFVVNGDIGKIVAVDGDHLIVDFTEPDRRVVLPAKNNDLLHAYCITCHRAQGSEAPVVIVPIHRQFNYFLSNAWLYTALSRGKQIVITIGTFSTIERAIKNVTPNNRTTRLKQRFVEYDRAEMEVEFNDI